MAKGDKWEQQHMEHLAKYEQEIRTIYNRHIEEATRIASSTGALGDKPFAFADYPLAHSRMKELQRHMAAEIKAVITKGADTEWRLSEEKTIELINSVYGDIGEEVIEVYRNAYLRRRDAARKAFNKRRSEGLNLSNRVWQYAGQFKEELEMALDLGIREGKSADELSRDVRRYLNNPNMLFRRVRDEHGILHLSKRAKAYHPGQGVYRSSYKNARRLTATETNIAYRNAEQSAWQALDFVVGQKIQLSNNHTLNGEPFIDICDHLQGNYPKDFVFTGWHPLCRCFATAILMTPEERQENSRRRLKGLPPIAPEDSKNYVAEPPKGFVAWVQNNAARIARSRSLPYFMRDNASLVAKVFHAKQPNTNMFRSLETTIPYFSKYVQRDPRVAAIYDEFENNMLTMSDIERTMLANELKSICANITFADLRDAGLIPDGMIMAGIDKEFVVHEGVTYYSKRQAVSIKEVRRDMIILRDRYGHKFAYPVGTDKDNMLISPASASEQFHSLPRYLTKDMERVSFYNIDCPADKYWRIEYNNPTHQSAATDGGRTSFWKCAKNMTDKEYKAYMAHESAHWLDTRYSAYKYSNSAEWANAVRLDIKIAKEGRGNVTMYPTMYAKTNLKEDFAESMMLFLTNRRKLKDIAPNRERYLHNLTKQLANRLHY